MTIKELENYYKKIIIRAKNELKQIKSKLVLLAMLRLAVVLLSVAFCYFFWHNSPIVIFSILAASISFIFLVKLYDLSSREKAYEEARIRLAKDELKALNYDFSSFDGAREFTNAKHNFSFDLDIFGEHSSFFQSINRTVTKDGKEKLAHLILNPLSNKKEILEQQSKVEDLKKSSDFIVDFLTLGQNREEQTDIKKLNEKFLELSLAKPLGKTFWRFGIYIMPIVSISSIVAYGLDHISTLSFLSLWVLFIIISTLPTKLLANRIAIWEKSSKTLDKYSLLLQKQEEYENSKTTDTKILPSTHIAKFSKLMENFGQAFTFPGILFLNPVMMWSTKYAIRVEKWALEHGKSVGEWVDKLAQFDANISVAFFAFNHPSYIFPEISETKELVAKGIGHPLLHRDKCVANDVKLENHPFFLIVTGANMAGKSTYLRTVAINLTLASIGAPVFANEFRFYPFELVTNLRTSDSLIEDESYFFAELKRLKMIIDKLNAGHNLFIILDEILKGTNSEDKQKGSIALMRQLIVDNACGIIATHDLVLGNLENEFPNEAKNYRFEADIKDDKLSFTYKIREGIAENMNASFLMRKMGITGL